MSSPNLANTSSSIALLGGGGHGSDVLSVIEALTAAGSCFDPVYVADDVWHRPERFEGRCEVKMVESIEAGARLAPFLVTIGYPAGRRAVHDLAVVAGGLAAAALVHPDALVSHGVAFGAGVVVMGRSWLSPMVELGCHTHVSYGAVIGHDTRIGDFCSIMPGACMGGDIAVGEGVLIGANATVLEGVTVGDGAQVGAGAVVTQDVPAETTVVGSPARPTES